MNKKQKPHKIFRGFCRFLLLVVVLFALLFMVVQAVYPVKYKEDVLFYAAEYDVDPYLVWAIIKAESNFDEKATSAKGAQGLMQLMPETAAWLSDKLNIKYEAEKLLDPAYSIQLGTYYMAFLLEQFNGNLTQVAAAYNSGQNQVRIWLQKGDWDGTKENIDQVPFAETKKYIKKILKNYNRYVYIYDTVK